jgi:hypothetical protein
VSDVQLLPRNAERFRIGGRETTVLEGPLAAIEPAGAAYEPAATA